MRLLAAMLLLTSVAPAAAFEDAPTSASLSIDAVFVDSAASSAVVATEEAPTSEGLTLRSLLAEPTPPTDEAAPQSRENRLNSPLRWATADPDNRLPFRAPPADWFRAPEEVREAAEARAARPDPMLELMRLHGGKLPPLAQRGFGEEGPTERIRRVSSPFLRIKSQGASVGVDNALVEIANATRESPARIVIEPVAPTTGSPSESALPAPLVLLLPPGTTEQLSLPAGNYRFQRFVWSMREVVDGRAKRLLAETFDEQRVAAGANYEARLTLDDERSLRRRLAN